MAFDPISAGIEFAGKVVDRIWPDATESQKAEASKVIAEMAHEETMFKAEVADRESARNRESAVATSADAPVINKVITPVLAGIVLVLSFVLFGMVVFDNDVIDASRKDIVIYILGVLSAIDTQIIAYYFGSSSGSVQKSDFMEKLIK
jgi:hypothetical protein